MQVYEQFSPKPVIPVCLYVVMKQLKYAAVFTFIFIIHNSKHFHIVFVLLFLYPQVRGCIGIGYISKLYGI